MNQLKALQEQIDRIVSQIVSQDKSIKLLCKEVNKHKEILSETLELLTIWK